MLIVGSGTKAKLNDTHSGHGEVLLQSPGVRIDGAQVLHDEGKGPECMGECIKQGLAGSVAPDAVSCGFGIRWNRPIATHPNEVVDANTIGQTKGASHPTYPPVKARFCHRIPIV